MSSNSLCIDVDVGKYNVKINLISEK